MSFPSGRLKAGSLVDLIYQNPKGVYNEFVNAFLRKEGAGFSKQVIIKRANEKWKQMKTNPESVEQYINSKT